MANKEVINVPADSYLLAIDDFVGDAGIVGIDFKTKRSKICDQLSALFIMP